VRTGKRFGFSAVEKGDIWRRWKAWQSLHEIGRAFDSRTAAFGVYYCLAEGFLPQPGVARAARSPWRNERIYRAGLLSVLRFVRLLDGWIEQPRR
jgi:hypothetical protein